jgi:hypothetical protein
MSERANADVTVEALEVIAARWPDECQEGVSRKGEFQQCDKAAVALRFDPEFEGDVYPVCAYHARGRMLPLREILAFNGQVKVDGVSPSFGGSVV